MIQRYGLVFVMLALVALAGATAQDFQGEVQSVDGKVEVRLPGESWQAASEGDVVPANATISTGFGARATVALGESSLIVKPLTRLTLVELVRKEGTVSTKAALEVGSVDAEVESSEGLSNDFEVRSTRSTAAVRGTQFSFDGVQVSVDDGVVTFSNNLGQSVRVSVGQGSRTTGWDSPSDVEDWVKTQTDTNAQTAGAGGTSSLVAAGAADAQTGTIRVNIGQ